MLSRLEQFASRRWVFAALLAALLATVGFTYRSVVGGDWFASGDDMAHILPELREGAPMDWVSGTWVGKRMFDYYRPVTSIAMWVQHRAFGETQAGWQAVSLGCHLAAVALVSLLLFNLFRLAIPALLGAAVWGFRGRVFETLEWTPAQTDLFAGVLGFAALLAFVRGIRRQSALLLGLSAIVALLAAGSKEVALVLPAVAAVIALFEDGVSNRSKAWIVATCAGLTICILAVRALALGGIGFLPGQAVGDSGRAAGVRPAGVLRNLLGFWLPAVMTPLSQIGWQAAWAAAVGGVAAWIAGRKRLVLGFSVGAAAFVAITFLLDDPGYWLLPQTSLSVLTAAAFGGAVLFVVLRRPRQTLMVILCGIALGLPLYHVVYNKAGNVRYFPDLFWAMGWALLAASLVSKETTAETRS